VERARGNDSVDGSNRFGIGAEATDMTRQAVLSVLANESARRAVLGSQVVLDLYECETRHLDDIEWVKKTLVNAARVAGATIVETVFHKFAPWGISGVVVIAESHLAIHIWPENRYAAIDLFTCGENVQLDAACAFLTREFRSRWPVQRRLTRGDHVGAPSRARRTLPSRRQGCGLQTTELAK
jgi:S-adenosylmethionine decarboxylase